MMNRVRNLVPARSRASLQRRVSVATLAPTPVSAQRRLGNAAASALPQVALAAPAGAAQMRLAISSPNDAFEREADSVGKQVASMPSPRTANTEVSANAPSALARRPLVRSSTAQGAAVVQRHSAAPIQRHTSVPVQRQTRADGSPAQASLEVSREIAAEQSDGEALPSKVKQFMEPRFGADFSKIKIHTDARAAKLANQVQAQAFTVGGHIFFGAGQYQPDTDEGKQLLAHELTHTIQQGAARQSAASPATATTATTATPARPAAITRAPASVARVAQVPSVRMNAAQSIQRLGWPSMQGVLDFFADQARIIPGYTLLTVILGFNPISQRDVARTGVNILRALVECIPLGLLLVNVLEANGLLQRGGAVAEREFARMTGAVADLKDAFNRFMSKLETLDFANPWRVWESAKQMFSAPIDRLKSAGTALVDVVLELVKQAVLQPLARLAQPTPAWDLLCAVLGKNPITGEAVQRSPQTMIGGFMKLIGQDEIWQNIQRANAIPRAWAWFQNQMSSLMALVTSLPQRFLSALQSLTLADVLTVVGAFAKIIGVFARFALDFATWAGNAIWELLKIIFEVLAPGAMPYLKKVGASLREIFKNPLPFVRNLARAGKLGFDQFMKRFGTHLKNGVIQWLTGSLPGIYIPQALNLQEIVKFVLSVLGISWAALRAKLVIAIGEPAVAALENSFELVKILVTQGPAAAWDKIKEHLGNLKEMVLDGIKDFIYTNVVTRATAKVASLLIPGAGFISAIVSIWDMIQVFIAQMRRMAEIGKAFLDSVMDIASGAIGNAANKVESVLGNLLTLAISFLAGFVGLGGVAAKVMKFLDTKVRSPIDKAMDKLVTWIVNAGRRVVAAVRGGNAANQDQNAMSIEQVLAQAPSTGERSGTQKQTELNQAIALGNRILDNVRTTAEVQAYFPRLKARFRLTEVSMSQPDGDGKRKLSIRVNPVDFTKGTQLLDGITSKITWGGTQNIGGANVAISMHADPLGIDHTAGIPTNGSEQKPLMKKLMTNSNIEADAAKRYIRGHLLNFNVGGPNHDDNLFPLTAAANTEHVNKVENTVKVWVNQRKHWVRYSVVVKLAGAPVLSGTQKSNNVDADFVCSLVGLDPNSPNKTNLQPIGTPYTYTVRSRFKGTNDLSHAPVPSSSHLPTSGPQALAATAQLPPSGAYKLDAATWEKLHALRDLLDKIAGTNSRAALMRIMNHVSGLHVNAWETLEKFLDAAKGADIAGSLPSTDQRYNATRFNTENATLQTWADSTAVNIKNDVIAKITTAHAVCLSAKNDNELRSKFDLLNQLVSKVVNENQRSSTPLTQDLLLKIAPYRITVKTLSDYFEIVSSLAQQRMKLIAEKPRVIATKQLYVQIIDTQIPQPAATRKAWATQVKSDIASIRTAASAIAEQLSFLTEMANTNKAGDGHAIAGRYDLLLQTLGALSKDTGEVQTGNLNPKKADSFTTVETAIRPYL